MFMRPAPGLLSECLACAALFAAPALTQQASVAAAPVKVAAAELAAAATTAPIAAAPDTPVQAPARSGLFYKRNWGVEIVGVRPVSSGFMLAFRYRVLDPEKAKVLNDRKSKAFLRDDATGAVFAVPAMENVGELRSGAAPEAGREYYMIFGNPGRMVKPGSRVTIIAGNFHAEGLIVDR